MILQNDGPRDTGPVPGIVQEMIGLFDPADRDAIRAVHEIAAGVQIFLADSSGAPVESGRVRALVSRALLCSGRKAEASRLLLLGGGLLKTSRSALVHSGTVLIMDLRRLVVKQDECLDLVFRRCLLLLVDSMAHMWDDVDGHGMLGLRNVRAAAEVVLGNTATPARVSLLAHETRSLFERRLGALRQKRRWGTSPVVCDLDWTTRTRKGRRGREIHR